MPRSLYAFVFASTSRIWHFGQIALTMSTSSAISVAQPEFVGGYVVPPLWFTFWKTQPVADADTVPLGHAGSPKNDR